MTRLHNVPQLGWYLRKHDPYSYRYTSHPGSKVNRTQKFELFLDNSVATRHWLNLKLWGSVLAYNDEFRVTAFH
jgi:hypothetical protein